MDPRAPPGLRGGAVGAAPRLQAALETKGTPYLVPPARPGPSPHSLWTCCQESEDLGNKEAKANPGERSPEPGGPGTRGHLILENAAPLRSPRSGRWPCPRPAQAKSGLRDPGAEKGQLAGSSLSPAVAPTIWEAQSVTHRHAAHARRSGQELGGLQSFGPAELLMPLPGPGTTASPEETGQPARSRLFPVPLLR